MSRPASIAAMLLIAWVTSGCHLLRTAAPGPLEVATVEAMPDFTTNAFAYGRDAGNSIRMDSHVLWVFGDTFDWTGIQCATGAISSVAHPSELNEPVDDWFSPFQFYDFSAAERSFNDDHSEPPDCCTAPPECAAGSPYCHCPQGTDCATRIAIWPGDLIDLDGSAAINYYEKVWVGSAPYDFKHLGTGIAVVEYGSTTASRPLDDSGEPLLMFGPGEPNFLRAMPVEEDGEPFVYLYAATNRHDCYVDILLARVRLEDAFDRSAYEHWDGNGWSNSLDDSAPVLNGILGGLGSVGWNGHLHRYISAFNDICTGGVDLMVRTAPSPEGPWSEATAIDLRPLGGSESSYAGQIHSSLSSGREVVFSFYQPLKLGIGRVRLGRITLD